MPNLDLLVLASAFAVSEGYFVQGSVPQRNNNPGDLRYAGQEGSVPSKDGTGIPFAKFDSPERGTCALLRQLAAYAQRGMSLRQIYTAYAPSSDGNNTELLINKAVQRVSVAQPGLQINPDVPLWTYLKLADIK